LQATGYRRPLPIIQNDPAVRAAAIALDETDEPLFARAGAILSIATFLDRLDALENDPARAATREADRAALARLAERGIDAAERARLRALVKTAMRATTDAPAPTPPRAPSTPAAPAELPVDQAESLRKLRAWYDDCSRTAKALIKRRDYLIALGLAKRSKKNKKGEAVAPVVDLAKAPA
jgi:hypothetical protein